MYFFQVKMKQWHLGPSLFWQSKSPKNVFCLFLLGRFSSITDFPYNYRSYDYLMEVFTISWICSEPSMPRQPMSSLNSLLKFKVVWAEIRLLITLFDDICCLCLSFLSLSLSLTLSLSLVLENPPHIKTSASWGH